MGVNELIKYLLDKELSPTIDNERKWIYVYSYLNDYRRPVGKIKISKILNLTDLDEFVVSCTLKAIYE